MSGYRPPDVQLKLEGVLRAIELGRCTYVEAGPDGMARECILRAHDTGRHVLLTTGYIARPIENVRVRRGVL